VYRPDVHLAVGHHLGDPHALRPGVGKIQFGGELLLEQIQMFRSRHRPDQHVQLVDRVRITLGQCA
jgi:hypothetical protein